MGWWVTCEDNLILLIFDAGPFMSNFGSMPIDGLKTVALKKFSYINLYVILFLTVSKQSYRKRKYFGTKRFATV